MIRRVVAIKFKPDITAEELRAHRRASFEIAEEVPQILRLRWFADVPDGESAETLDQANLYDFEDIAGIQAFLVAPPHIERARNVFHHLRQKRIVLNHAVREADYGAPDATGSRPRLHRLSFVKFGVEAEATSRTECLSRWMELAQDLQEIKRYSGLPHLPDGQDDANYDWVDLFEFEDLISLVSFLRHPRRAALERDLRALVSDRRDLSLDIEAAVGVDKGLRY